MNQYLLFAGASYYPSPGWKDFQCDFATLEEARVRAMAARRMGWDWCHIVDTETKQIVEWYR